MAQRAADARGRERANAVPHQYSATTTEAVQLVSRTASCDGRAAAAGGVHQYRLTNVPPDLTRLDRVPVGRAFCRGDERGLLDSSGARGCEPVDP